MIATEQKLFDPLKDVTELNAAYWHGSFNGKESTLHQLSPYVGKLKSGMAQVLIHLYSKPGDIVFDPFSGSGVAPLEAALMGRRPWANDLSPYAHVLTKAKLSCPSTEEQALNAAAVLACQVEKRAPQTDTSHVPEWIRAFYHPNTLKEIVAAFHFLDESQNHFLTGCLLGILHHQRPGFLSYPASHLVPYLRTSKYPPEDYPEMYTYRDVRSRLVKKVKRAYRRSFLTTTWDALDYRVWQTDAAGLSIDDGAVDTIISSPPYFGALDYARDNRMRLWFLGCEDWKALDAALTASKKVYVPQMTAAIQEMARVLKPGGYCVLVLGDVNKNGKMQRTAEVLAEIATAETDNAFSVETIYDDVIPDERRSRRETKTTKFERILVMRRR